MFVAVCSFVPPFLDANFCGVLPCVFDKLGSIVGEKRIADHLHKVYFVSVDHANNNIAKHM